MENDFEHENAFLLSKFDDLKGKIDYFKANNQSLQHQVNGLRFENQKLEEKISNLKKYNSRVKSEFDEINQKLDQNSRLMPQNFIIRNKIVKIVSDIEDKELSSTKLLDIVELMIQEIDFCINHLEK